MLQCFDLVVIIQQTVLGSGNTSWTTFIHNSKSYFTYYNYEKMSAILSFLQVMLNTKLEQWQSVESMKNAWKSLGSHKASSFSCKCWFHINTFIDLKTVNRSAWICLWWFFFFFFSQELRNWEAYLL